MRPAMASTESTFLVVNSTIGKQLNVSAAGTFGTCDLSKTANSKNIAFAIGMTVLLLASLIGNSLVVIAATRSRQLRRRVTVLFIVSLACSDLAFAVILIPFNVSYALHQRFCAGIVACYISIYTDVFCNIASILNLFLIAIDRFVAIQSPLRYGSLMTKPRARKLIVLVWAFAAFWALIGFFKWDRNASDKSSISVVLNGYCANRNYYYYTVSYFAMYLLPLTIMSITYCMILHLALTQIKTIENIHVQVSCRRTESQSPEEFKLKQQKERRQRKRKKELKATKSVAMVYFAFFICWFPNLVLNFIIMFDPLYFPRLKAKNSKLVDFIYYCFVLVLPAVNTAVNPLIYSFSNTQFRVGFKSVFKSILRQFGARHEEEEHALRTDDHNTLDEQSNLYPTTVHKRSNRRNTDSSILML